MCFRVILQNISAKFDFFVEKWIHHETFANFKDKGYFKNNQPLKNTSMKRIVLLFFLIVLTNSWCQEVLSNVNNDKVRAYHQGLNGTKLLFSNGESEQALDQIIEVLELDLGYGDDAYILLSRFLENIPKQDSVYLNKISEFSLLLSKCGITFKEIETMFTMVNKYGNQFRADSLKSKYHISYYE